MTVRSVEERTNIRKERDRTRGGIQIEIRRREDSTSVDHETYC